MFIIIIIIIINVVRRCSLKESSHLNISVYRQLSHTINIHFQIDLRNGPCSFIFIFAFCVGFYSIFLCFLINTNNNNNRVKDAEVLRIFWLADAVENVQDVGQFDAYPRKTMTRVCVGAAAAP